MPEPFGERTVIFVLGAPLEILDLHRDLGRVHVELVDLRLGFLAAPARVVALVALRLEPHTDQLPLVVRIGLFESEPAAALEQAVDLGLLLRDCKRGLAAPAHAGADLLPRRLAALRTLRDQATELVHPAAQITSPFHVLRLGDFKLGRLALLLIAFRLALSKPAFQFGHCGLQFRFAPRDPGGLFADFRFPAVEDPDIRFDLDLLAVAGLEFRFQALDESLKLAGLGSGVGQLALRPDDFIGHLPDLLFQRGHALCVLFLLLLQGREFGLQPGLFRFKGAEFASARDHPRHAVSGTADGNAVRAEKLAVERRIPEAVSVRGRELLGRLDVADDEHVAEKPTQRS